ncbi:MAG: hypothetical protein H7Y27_14500, partial [Gemmatimonadaceae bacterium]|nr:hypothetical protein [Chitinophagaceae bacterium]
DKTQKRLRLPATADWKDYTLDLRKDSDLERSVFLHRLLLLDIRWGENIIVSGKGTFKEQWRLQWDPAISIQIIEKGSYGNTTEEAASKYLLEQAAKASSLPQVCGLLNRSVPAEIPKAVEALINKINNLAAASSDVVQLMEVIPGLVVITRYGSVRKTDETLLLKIVYSMISRVCIGLPAACTGIDDDAATHLFDLFYKIHDAVNLLQQPDIVEVWHKTLLAISSGKNSSPVLAGYSTRLLSDSNVITRDQLTKVFSYSMSIINPTAASAWLEGFLKGSGTLLLIDTELWNMINEWIKQVSDESFVHTLPLLRRTFANFSPAERRKLGEKAKAGGVTVIAETEYGFDEQRAANSIPVMMKLFGYKINK